MIYGDYVKWKPLIPIDPNHHFMESKVRFFFVAHLGPRAPRGSRCRRNSVVFYSEAVATPISKKFSVTLDEHLDEFEVFDSWYQKDAS